MDTYSRIVIINLIEDDDFADKGECVVPVLSLTVFIQDLTFNYIYDFQLVID